MITVPPAVSAGLAAMVPGVLVSQRLVPSLPMAKVFLPRSEMSSLLPTKRSPVAASTAGSDQVWSGILNFHTSLPVVRSMA